MDAARNLVQPKQGETPQKAAGLYQTFWRWHFYAGILFAPFLIVLSISGALYLYQAEIETMLYKDKLVVQDSGAALPLSEQVAAVKREFPKAEIGSIRLPKEADRTTQVKVTENDVTTRVYVNPYNAKITGTILDEKHFTNVAAKLHSEWIVGGTFVNRFVELAACWTVILLITGLYIWWPRNRKSIWGTVLPRFSQKGRTFWRDMHAVPAFWLSLLILVLIVTGLPWSGVMGEGINKIATSSNTGYPVYAFMPPKSDTATKDVADDVPWAAENVPVPKSGAENGGLDVDQVTALAVKENIQKPYTISLPEGKDGVFTISSSRDKPENEATVYFDQYSGKVVEDVRFSDYGWMAKAVSIGIALHEGRYFGLANQLLGTVAALGLVGIVISSLVMWRIRKPKGKLGAPQKNGKVKPMVILGMAAAGVVMPLAGLSFIVVYVMDRFVFRRIKPLKSWLY
ncbi:PepSY-associated TM helix domain-containing protein [Fictibacillus aquaticus]|uniref:Iron-regulated protein n=1 Tax=Fictibacillus aquaticus TaxID=2021314 RepID=A0A235FDW0_9BACL|nr:PepSY domain-containing protein [Fictibacillus aquaticus]OYD59511.1 iron-regulated protein [Fictibacillus aquaticus]